MDATTQKLVDYALNACYEDLSASAVEACKLRILDTLGCVAGAYDHPVSVAVRSLAGRYRMDANARNALFAALLARSGFTGPGAAVREARAVGCRRTL